jgi:predicted nucleic acid-binding protein
MGGNFFVDTNIFVYFRDASEAKKQKAASLWLKRLWERREGRISWQVLSEYYVTVTQKLKPGLDRDVARADVRNLMSWNPVVVNGAIMKKAWELQDQSYFSWWDSLIIAAALEAGCATLLSEDLQHGQVIHGLTITNPFITNFE